MLGPPDIESRIGLTGGNIFQGEVTPDQMWEGRLRRPDAGRRASTSAAPPPTRPGSVIALNGRNAAAAVLADAGRRDRRRLSRAAMREALPSRRGRD